MGSSALLWLAPRWQRAGNARKASSGGWGGVAQAGEMPRHVHHFAVTPACIRLDTHPVPPPCSPRGAVDLHVAAHKPTVTGGRSPVSTVTCWSCPHTSMGTRTHAQSPARS